MTSHTGKKVGGRLQPSKLPDSTVPAAIEQFLTNVVSGCLRDSLVARMAFMKKSLSTV